MSLFGWFKKKNLYPILIEEFKGIAEVIVKKAPHRKLDSTLYWKGFDVENPGEDLVVISVNGKEIKERFWYSRDSQTLWNALSWEKVTPECIKRYLDKC